MKKRGPPSTASLAIVTVPIRSVEAPLSVPASLTAPEAAVWRQTIAALPRAWLRGEQGPILERYCKHVVRAQCLETLIAATNPASDLDVFAKLMRLAGEETARILALSRSMRLTSQSRIHPVTAGARAAGSRPAPDIAEFMRDRNDQS